MNEYLMDGEERDGGWGGTDLSYACLNGAGCTLENSRHLQRWSQRRTPTLPPPSQQKGEKPAHMKRPPCLSTRRHSLRALAVLVTCTAVNADAA